MANVAELGIVVKQQGVEKAANALAKLSGEAKRTSENLDKLMPTLKSLSNLNLTSTAVEVRQIAMSIATLAKAMKDISSVSTSMTKATTSITSLATASLKLGEAATKLSGMSKELSTLQTALSGFGNSAAGVTQLRAEVGNLITNIRNAQATASKGITVNSTINQTRTVGKGGGGGVERVAVSRTDADNMGKIASNADKATNSVYAMGRGLATMRNTLFNLVAFGGFTALATSAIKAADTMTLLESKVRLVTNGTKDFNLAQESLFNTSLKTGQGIEASTEMFVRMKRATEDAGISTERVLNVSEGLAKAMVVGGDSVGSFNSAMYQMSQGFAANALRGQELNSVAEQAGLVFKALQKGLGMTAGELRKFASEGKLTTEVSFKGLEKGLKAINDDFERMPRTVEQATNALDTRYKKALAEINKETQTTAKLATAIDELGQKLTEYTPAMAAFANAIPTVALIGLALAAGKAGGAVSLMGLNLVNNVKGAKAAAVAYRDTAIQARGAALATLLAANGVNTTGIASKASTVASLNYAKACTAVDIANRNVRNSSILAAGAVRGLNTALAAIGGIPGLVVGGLILLGTHFDWLAAKAGNAAAQTREAAKEFRNALALQDMDAARSEIDKMNESLITQREEYDALEKKQKMYIKGDPRAKLINRQLKTKQEQLDETWKNIQKSEKDLAAAERIIDLQNESKEITPPKPETPQAKTEKTPSISSFEKQESKIESVIESYKRNIAAMNATGKATKQLNKHEEKAIELTSLLAKAKNAKEKASYSSQIALQKEAAALLKQQESLEEYYKLKKEISLADKQDQEDRDYAILTKRIDEKYQKQKLEHMKLEIDLQKRLNDIRNNEKLQPNEKRKLMEDEIRATENKKARVPENSIQAAGDFASEFGGVFAFQSIDKIKELGEQEMRANEEITARRLEALAAEQDAYINNMQLFEEKKLQITKDGAIARQNIEKDVTDATLAATKTTLTSMDGYLGSFNEILSAAGAKGTAISKALFVAQKAIAISKAIVDTEAAATASMIPDPTGATAAAIRSQGYMSVAIMTATSVAEMVSGKFAKGAAFHKGNVVSSPTTFGMSGGRTGLMGEAGAEAVMPLTRDSSGRLGVSVQNGGGGGGSSVNTSINVTVTGNADETTVDEMVGEIKKIVDYQIVQQMRAGGLLTQRR